MKVLATKTLARRVLLAQAGLTCGLASVGALWGVDAGLSALMGGLVVLLANGIFAVLIFMPYHAQQPGQLLRRIYLAEVVKLIVMGLEFAVAFFYFQWLNAAVFFIAFFLVQVVSVLFAQGGSSEHKI